MRRSLRYHVADGAAPRRQVRPSGALPRHAPPLASAASLGFEDTLRGRRVLAQLFRWSSWPGYQLSPAVRATAPQNPVGAGTTEGALERANQGIRRFGRKVAITALTIWPELEHRPLLDVRLPLGSGGATP